ncbi:MAG TPA: tyrosine-protein phosphatase [Solirubrobacterales bacterium]|nr:tyrosine-protein phosphatase [Solirubrobacterales bacterium]
MVDRHLDWEGCFNTRDLGGLPTAAGGETRFGQLVRSDSLATLSADGWAALAAFGVRTVVDLRNESEIDGDAAPRPAAIETIHIPLDVGEDREFWDVWETGPQFGTPLYYRPHLERFPERSAEVVRAIARAGPGGVAFHCVGGRDRAGQVAMLVLALAGVEPEAIARDHGLSSERLEPLYAARGQPSPEAELASFLRQRGTTAGEVIVATLAALDVEATLLAGGLEPTDVNRLRRRLLGEAG